MTTAEPMALKNGKAQVSEERLKKRRNQAAIEKAKTIPPNKIKAIPTPLKEILS